MQVSIGKNANDPDLTRNRYRDRWTSTTQLQNGNVEEGYKSGRELRCRVFFELDRNTETIVRWRYEGTEDDCSIAP